MDEDGEKVLEALAAAPDHPMQGYLELDGFANALDYVCRAEQFLRNLDDPLCFKWVTLCLSNALYGFMICVLGDGNPYRVIDWPSDLKKKLQALVRVGTSDANLEILRLRDEHRRAKKSKLIKFSVALSRLRKFDRQGPAGMPARFELSSKQVNDVLTLRREYRDYFEHYIPLIWAVEEAVFLGLFDSCNSVIREVVSDLRLRYMHREDTATLDATIDRVDELLKKHRERLT